MKKNLQFTSSSRRKWNRILLFTKLKFILILLISCSSASATVYPQGEKLSVQMQGVSLEEVIWDMQKKTGLNFMYGAKDIEAVKGLTVNMKDMTIQEILDFCLRGTGLTHELSGSAVIIKKAIVNRQAETVRLVGVVKDTDGNPVQRAIIMVKGTAIGVSSGVDGRYAIDLPRSGGVVLTVSFLSKKTREIKWNGEIELNIVLEEDVKKVEEVVVTGYNNVNRRDMVGTYKQIKAEDIMMPAYTSIDQMLQGEVAGLMVINTSSRAGASPTLKLRGTATIHGSQSPLWVVDGIIQEEPLKINATSNLATELKDIIGSQISWLNPNDIETVTVLKDASAAAVYGSMASNGVIVVTTKKNKGGQISVSYMGNVSINTRPNYGQFNFMNSKERTQFSEEVFAAGAFYAYTPIKQPYTYEGVMRMYQANEISQDEYFNLKENLETVNTDWFKRLTRTGVSHNHNVSIGGGAERMRFNASLGYANKLGQEIGNDSENMTARIAVNSQLRNNLSIDLSLYGSTTTTNSFGKGVDPMSYATNTSRAIPAVDENGDRVFYRQRASYLYNNTVKELGYNFENERDNSGSKVNNLRLSATLSLNWKLLDWLTYQFTGGLNKISNANEGYFTENTYNIASKYRGYEYGTAVPGSALFNAAILPFGGELLTSDGSQFSYNIQNKLIFSKQFNSDHRLNAMAAMEIRSNHNKSISNTVWGYVPERGQRIIEPASYESFTPIGIPKPSLLLFKNLYTGSWNRTEMTNNYVSIFATAAYTYKNKYTGNVVFRNDFSNRFGQDVNKRFDPNYSFGFAWQLSEEPFMEAVSYVIPRARLKATFGILGNVVNTLSPDLILHQDGVANVYNTYFSGISSLPNPGLSWESTYTWDFGVEFNLFHIFDVEANYYMKRSDVIIDQNIAYEYGIQRLKINGGRLNNHGIEFTVSATPVNTKNWSFNLSLNSSKNWNKVGKVYDNPTLSQFLNGASGLFIKEGYPVGGFWSFSYAGLSSEDGHPLFNYMDLTAEKYVDPTSFLVYSGTKEPDFTGGLNFSLRYKSFRLSSSMALVLGGKKRLPNPYENFQYNISIPEPTVNISKELYSRWKQPGDEKFTDIPALASTLAYNITLPNGTRQSWYEMWNMSDLRVVDASFLRCKQISISWIIPGEITRRIGVASCSVNANVNNVFVIASKRFNGFDPELGTSVMPKVYSLGINIGF